MFSFLSSCGIYAKSRKYRNQASVDNFDNAIYLASKVPKEHPECLGTKSSGECRPTSAFSGAPVTLAAAFADESADGVAHWSLVRK
jgi:hypothetical protein